MTLFLSDFICQEHASTLPGCEEVVIEVTAKQLCDIYDEAVGRQLKENETISARASAPRAASSRDAATRGEDIRAEAASGEYTRAAAPEPENRRMTRSAARGEDTRAAAPEPEDRRVTRGMVKKKIGQILRRSEWLHR